MRRILRATILACLLLAAVDAWSADLPVPVAPAVQALTDTWSGPWAGVYGGGAFADPNGVFSLSSASLNAVPTVISTLNAAGSGTLAARGAIFGVQGGWNTQIEQNFVVGVEGDFSFWGPRGNRAVGGTVPVFEVPFTNNQSLSVDWQSALRLRADYAFSNFALAYAEAGPAVAEIHYASSYWDEADETENVSLNSLKLGVSLGAGVEFAKNVSVSAEYLYSHFSSVNGVGTSLLADGTTANVAHSSGALDESAFRLGLNYYFR